MRKRLMMTGLSAVLGLGLTGGVAMASTGHPSTPTHDPAPIVQTVHDGAGSVHAHYVTSNPPVVTVTTPATATAHSPTTGHATDPSHATTTVGTQPATSSHEHCNEHPASGHQNSPGSCEQDHAHNSNDNCDS